MALRRPEGGWHSPRAVYDRFELDYWSAAATEA
jgi:hypothetical protein